MRTVSKLVVLATLTATSVSCGDVVRQGRSPVYLIMNSLQAASGGNPLLSDVLTTGAVFNDFGEAVLRLGMKDIGTPANPTTPTSNNAVTITRYRVEYQRSDGRNTQGVDVPFAFDGAATATVALSTTTVTFEMVRHVAKQESPLVQLIQNPQIISTIANVTFYGRDAVGNELSIMGSMHIEFGNFADQ
jgi:hypothetical protein